MAQADEQRRQFSRLKPSVASEALRRERRGAAAEDAWGRFRADALLVIGLAAVTALGMVFLAECLGWF